jgi:hypothetical protein
LQQSRFSLLLVQGADAEATDAEDTASDSCAEGADAVDMSVPGWMPPLTAIAAAPNPNGTSPQTGAQPDRPVPNAASAITIAAFLANDVFAFTTTSCFRVRSLMLMFSSSPDAAQVYRGRAKTVYDPDAGKHGRGTG